MNELAQVIGVLDALSTLLTIEVHEMYPELDVYELASIKASWLAEVLQ